MTESPGTTARELLDEARQELADTDAAIRAHPFLDRLRRGEVSTELLRALAGEQHVIISSDRRSFSQLATRFSSGLGGDFFLGMAEGEGIALGKLGTFADWLGMSSDDFRQYEPRPGAHAYPAYVAWLALNGSRTDVALAFLVNLAAWGSNCGRVAAALREVYAAPEQAVAFFEFFASPPPDFESQALAVIDEGLATGDSPLRARRAARLLQAYELMFWDAFEEPNSTIRKGEG
ncbi:transcriptional regulator [Haloechinothrix sp. LS1_15]|uniref:transcriptional regulator n=1 Tax=Haloechinothrix sp. LS1_15 TaxID=2652248 RepID=UPI002944C661|nr:transcriptional regulator [Haloechinothrix sp. LS1_15]MDV6012338.1 transcriptional regulator [Haloechinothrix sp. LS1_15]